MSPFYITDENSEDTFDCTDNLQDAIRIARDVAQHGQAGDLVSVEHDGLTVRQFVLMPAGQVTEVPVQVGPG
jgi:hypothetical protein